MSKKVLLPLIIVIAISVLAGRKVLERKFEETIPPKEEAVGPAPAVLEFVKKYEDYVQNALASEGVPGVAVAIVKDSAVVFLKGFGLRKTGTQDSVDVHTLFRLASLSKGFAPVLTGILVEQGCLDWDDRVVDFIPDFVLKAAENTNELSLRHVLSHTTGLPRHTYSNLLNMGVDYATILEMLKEVDIAHPVGEYYNYQNVAFSLIGDVIENATHKPYGEQLFEKVFLPLAMNDASTSFEAISAQCNVAFPHSLRGKRYLSKDMAGTYYSVVPAAGINASISDMAKWLLLLLGNRPDIISNITLEEIFSPQIGTSHLEKSLRSWRPLEKAFYGLGWRVLDRKGQRIICHSGYVNGYRADIGFNRDEKIAIAVLSNASSRFSRECLPVFFDMYFSDE